MQLIYISDGNYDAGHYDLVMEKNDVEQKQKVDDLYKLWRHQKVYDLKDWNISEPGNNANYGNILKLIIQFNACHLCTFHFKGYSI